LTDSWIPGGGGTRNRSVVSCKPLKALLFPWGRNFTLIT